MVVAAGDHRDDTSGVTAALDRPTNMSTRGQRSRSVAGAGGRCRLGTVDQRPAGRAGRRATGAGTRRRTRATVRRGRRRSREPAVIPASASSARQRQPPVAVAPESTASSPPAVAVRPAAPERPAPAPTVHPLIAGDPLLTGSTPVVRRAEPEPEVAPQTERVATIRSHVRRERFAAEAAVVAWAHRQPGRRVGADRPARR